jgi:release factor glutamine methyltransferase
VSDARQDVQDAQDVQDVKDALARGRQPFLGIELLTAPGTLVPRPETELLGKTALAVLADLPGEPRVIDMCCGSGNLGVAIAASNERLRVWCADLTEPCVALARRNTEHVGVARRVSVFQGDLFDCLPEEELLGRTDVIVCNPPYISSGKLAADRAELLNDEPREAFDGGPFGLSLHQRVLAEAPRWLVPGGALLFEFGLGQDRQLRALFARAKVYRDLRFETNSAGESRVCIAFTKE